MNKPPPRTSVRLLPIGPDARGETPPAVETPFGKKGVSSGGPRQAKRRPRNEPCGSPAD